jgi:adenylate kinase
MHEGRDTYKDLNNAKVLTAQGGDKKIKHILPIIGTPGVGKSSVSRLLASRIGARLISLGDLVRKEGLITGEDVERETSIVNLEKVSESVEKKITSSVRDVIVEGHYAMDVVSPKKVHLAFVLRRDPQELRDILEERNYREEKVRENLAAEILDVCLYDAVDRLGVDKVCEVDVTSKKVGDAVEEILLILNGRKECKVGLVDWLGRMESEGTLTEYFKDL